MGRIHVNVVANFAGQAWVGAISVLLVPVYVQLLGIASYGLIGFFVVLQASFQVLDLGLSQTVNRELARLSNSPEGADQSRDFVRTLEVGYWVVGAVLGTFVIAAAPAIARHWLNAGTVPLETVTRAVAVMGAVAALQWPLSFYEGGLLGLQRQVPLNSLKIAVATIGGGGAVVVLWLVSPSVVAYFAWQGVASAIHVVSIATLLRRSLPAATRRARISPGLVARHWRFAVGMSGISVSAVVLMNLDKVIVSRLLPLDAFGYYTLAGVVSAAVPILVVGPVFNAVFPRLTALAAAGDEQAVARLYHGAAQVVVVGAASALTVLGMFSVEILRLWTRSDVAATTAGPILSLLVVGGGLNALMTMPYALQLAHGWTGIGVRLNALLIALMLPSVLLLIPRYGAAGAAATWAGLNAVYLALGVPLTHRRLLRGEMRSFICRDILPAGVTAVAVAGVARLAVSPRGSGATVATVALVFAATLLASALAAPTTRRFLLALPGIRGGRRPS